MSHGLDESWAAIAELIWGGQVGAIHIMLAELTWGGVRDGVGMGRWVPFTR